MAEHGEVFTNEREVKAMLEMVKSEYECIESRFLDREQLQHTLTVYSGFTAHRPNYLDLYFPYRNEWSKPVRAWKVYEHVQFGKRDGWLP